MVTFEYVSEDTQSVYDDPEFQIGKLIRQMPSMKWTFNPNDYYSLGSRTLDEISAKLKELNS